MKEQQQNIRNNEFFRFASSKKHLKIFVPDFAFKHDDNDIGKDKFVGRELLFRKLYTWLTSDSKSGSYLVTGYRGMGKSLLVHRVINSIAREPKTYKEVLFMLANVFLFVACYLFISCSLSKEFKVCFDNQYILIFTIVSFLLSCIIVGILFASLVWTTFYFEGNVRRLPHHGLYHKDMVSKFFVKRIDKRERVFENIAITINLGQEILDERDVLSLIAQNIKDKYTSYVRNRQRRPIRTFVLFVVVFIVSFILAKFIIIPVLRELVCYYFDDYSYWKKYFSNNIVIYHVFNVLIYAFLLWIITISAKWIRKHVPKYSVPYESIDRLNILCDRISSTISEEKGINKRYSNRFFSLPFYSNRKRFMPMANVREIEQELLAIINNINSKNCPKEYQAQFIIVFDELDKITKASDQLHNEENTVGTNLPNFETSVKGFTDTMAYEERKQNVLRLLANMKLFIATVKAKCVFISGHELFDASLADLSDREFAVSSIFNGVLNVSSFLSPEREETDVSSMTEMYVANMLLPENYLMKKIQQNASDNLLLKDEQPSLRWYNEYLMETHVLDNDTLKTKEDARGRVLEIRYAIEFLRYFCVYLSHVSNGSPKKIASYFEKYIKTNYDTIRQFDWNDEIVVGVPKEKDIRKQCVLFFNANDQKLINFVHYLASPVMSAVTNEMSNYGDKLLVSTSFMLDQIYKYHGNGFSWRNLELTPELLTSNKNPELRDSMASILEFLLQLHITPISSGVFQYKFHKQISEEISTLSKISEEAAAIFNFTLNESENVKRYNTRLLEHYLGLSKSTKDLYHYGDVLERIHENLGDIYFSEEDYYRAIHEYRSAMQYITDTITPNNALAYIKCCLKIGMSYEYRRTYENAYMVYCQIINKLVHMKWIEEGDLGLDYTMRLTKDWRVKQPVMVDKDSMKYSFGFLADEQYRRQFFSGLWEDIKKDDKSFICAPRYSLDSDKAISGLAAIYTPEKSDVFLRLTAFEDVKFIYQAIIAKLFVTEKMEVSGITQSSIDEAEAEFKTLHNAVNLEEKFMIAADFFSKIAEILYYKNNFVITSPTDNLSSALYTFDINVWEFIDDYCFVKGQNVKDKDAITIKDDVYSFFEQLKAEDIIGEKNTSNNSDWWVSIKQQVEKKQHKEEISSLFEENVKGYIDYVHGLNVFKVLDGNDNNTKKRIIDCINRRKALILNGRRLPCNACKYANRSLNILMDKMFVNNKNNDEKSRVIRLLLNTSRMHVRNLRQEQVSLLASISEQMADNMLSCACTKTVKANDNNDTICDTLSGEVITLIINLSESTMIPETKRQEMIKNIDKTDFSTLDRAVLYYWAACRYYEIATMYKEATHCVERIMKVVESYLSVVYHEKQYAGNDSINEKLRTGIRIIVDDKTSKLFEKLFNYAAILIGRQFDNYNLAEIHEYKWLFHLEYADNMDLTKLSLFPNLQSIFLSAVNCKIYYHQLRVEEKGNKEYKDYLCKIYHRVAPAFQHENTFKAEFESYFMKAYLNRLVLEDIIEKDPIVEERKHYFAGGKRDSNNLEKEYHQVFYTQIKKYLESNTTGDTLAAKIFKVQSTIESKLDLLDFLVVDSMVSLSNILKIVTLHSQLSTFPNNHIARIYELLWEWSKFYEMLYFLYIYYRYDKESNVLNKEKIIKMITRTSLTLEENCTNEKEEHRITEEKTKELLDSLMVIINNGNLTCKDNFGYRYSKLFANVRHEMDDSTIHHIYTNYSAEMAIKYYKAARGINSEGVEYKDMISNMFVLDDDLKNDTYQSNLADERYLLNSGIIASKYQWIQYIYKGSGINELENYEKEPIVNDNPFDQLPIRFEDSIYINTEY